MADFALITEGKTDQIVLENILCGYFKDPDLDINWLQPLYDATDKAREESFGNWLNVLEYCKSSKLTDALQYNNYVIIQMDTDISEEPQLNIPKYENGKDLSVKEMVRRFRDKLIEIITEEIYNCYADRILFAICVHSLECWLLPLYDERKADSTKGCEDKLKISILKKDKKLGFNKDIPVYDTISRPYSKNKILKKSFKKNESFRIFMEDLERKGIEIE